MYSLDEVLRGLRHPKLLFRELNRAYHTRLGTRRFNPSGVDIFEEDWDNLVILDACRYDVFGEESRLPGELEKKESRASSTIEFLEANFSGKDLADTVYVTANPQLGWNSDSLDVNLHAVVNVWEDTGWEKELKTVLPETVTDRALEAAEEHPDKRLVVHYMQPHAPFLTDSDWDKEPASVSVWYDIIMGKVGVTREEVLEAYVETLREALPHVAQLMENLDGRTVVTSDHGNFLGERSFPFPVREWGHPQRTFHPVLVEVPWLVHENGERRDIVSGSGGGTGRTEEENVRKKLEHLGYMT